MWCQGLTRSWSQAAPLYYLSSTCEIYRATSLVAVSRAASGSTHVELHFRVAVAALYAELPKLGEHPEKFPLALVHEDALIRLHLFWRAPQRDVDVLN